MHENHAHCAHSHTSNKTVLRNSFLMISAFMLIEVAGGFATNSLALLSDAGHMLSDAAALGLSLLAFKFGERKGNLQKTFGYRRIEILAATINALVVVVIAVFIVIEAARRLQNPPEVATAGMLAISTLGLAVNIVVALYMLRGGDVRENVNMRGAYLHVLADMFGSVAVIIAGIVIRFTGFQAADTIASVIIAALILPRSVQLLMEALRVLLEQVPAGVDLDAVHAALVAVPGVEEVHDLHVWSVDGTDLLASAHIVVSETPAELAECSLLDAATAALADHGIKHSTIQLESSAHAEHEEINH